MEATQPGLPPARVFSPLRRMLRQAWRVPLIGLWVFGGLLTALGILWAFGPRGRGVLMRGFARGLLMMLGVRLIADAVRPLPDRTLLVGNHISWIDIYVMQAFAPVVFIAKQEIRQWPVIGLLVALVGTVFIDRGSRRAMTGVIASAEQKLASRLPVMFFPEGTTSLGLGLKPFYSSLFVLAERLEDIAVVPVTLRYLQDGQPTTVPAFVGEMGLVDSMLQILAHPGLEARPVFHPALPRALPRAQACQAAESAIASALPPLISHQSRAAETTPRH